MASARNRYGGTGTPTGAGALSAARAITQSAAGVPTHVAPKNALYRNESTGILYINTNGSTGWAAVGGGASTPVIGPPGMDGRDGEDSYVPGPPGTPGMAGSTGPPGVDGRDGEDGERGPPGRDGSSGTNGTNGADGRMGAPGWDAEPADDLGLWLPPAVPASPRFRSQSGALIPAGALYDTYPRWLTSVNLAAAASGTVYLFGIDLPIDLVCTSISIHSGSTPLALGVNQLFGLYDQNLKLLRSSVDDGATAWAFNAIKTLALTSLFRTTYSGFHYLAILIVATTPPTWRGVQALAATALIAPILSGNSSTGQTSLPATAGALSGGGTLPYAYIS